MNVFDEFPELLKVRVTAGDIVSMHLSLKNLSDSVEALSKVSVLGKATAAEVVIGDMKSAIALLTHANNGLFNDFKVLDSEFKIIFDEVKALREELKLFKSRGFR